jgi:carboxymethylenebutenolidase
MALGPDAIWPLGGYPSVDKYGADADDRAREMQKSLNGGKITEDFVAAAEFLLKHPQSTGKLGAVGFCFGGGIVNTLAVRMPQLAAGVPFYGAAPAVEDVPKIKAALLLNFAETDPNIKCPVARIRSRPQGAWRQIRSLCVPQNESRLP